MSLVIPLRLDPCDPLLFRDGRPFDAAARVQGGMPNPQVLAGALRTAMLAHLGFKFDVFTRERKRADLHAALTTAGAPSWWKDVRFRGPWPALASDERVEPLFPLPEIVYARKVGGWGRAVPYSEAPGWWTQAIPPLPLRKQDEPNSKADRGLVTLTGLKTFLNGGDVPPGEVIPHGLIHQPDSRIGIEIDFHNWTSAEGQLYAVEYKAMNPRVELGDRYPHLEKYAHAKVAFYAEVVLPMADPGFFADDTPVPFGGEGKYIAARKTAGVSWPAEKRTGKHLLYLASPAFLNGTPPLPRLAGLIVKAAASGAGVAVSGWDVARNGPRPTRFAVPAGAVYFVEGTAELPHDSLDPLLDNRLEGWGFTLTGAWNT